MHREITYLGKLEIEAAPEMFKNMIQTAVNNTRTY